MPGSEGSMAKKAVDSVEAPDLGAVLEERGFRPAPEEPAPEGERAKLLAAALKTNALDLAHVKSFVLQKLLPNLAVFTVAKLAGNLAGLDWLAGVAWAAVEADLLGDLADSLGRLGLPMPGALMKGKG